MGGWCEAGRAMRSSRTRAAAALSASPPPPSASERALAARPTPMIVAAQPAARRRPGGVRVASLLVDRAVRDRGWRQVMLRAGFGS